MTRILIVDDEESLRQIMVLVLQKAGFEAEGVPNGIDALRLLDAGNHFDLVTTDLMNTPMSGERFILKMRDKFPEIPVLVITASREELFWPHVLRKGPQLDPEQLVLAVKRMLEKHRES